MMQPEGGSASEAVNVASPLPQFLLLYGALYFAYGAESAYLPAFMLSHSLPVQRIGLVFAAGTLVRIVIGPAIGRIADRLHRRKAILAISAGLSSLIDATYLLASGLLPLLGVSMAHSAATVSLAPLSDALSVAASTEGRGFQYGWVRGAGSATFVLGTLLSGQLISRFGLSCIIVSSSLLFLTTAFCAIGIREYGDKAGPPKAEQRSMRSVFAIPAYRQLIIVVVLVIGSHAMNDTFAVINWRAAGYGSEIISLLWSVSVVAEVLVFLLVGPWLIKNTTPSRCAYLSAGAGVLRWSVMGATTWAPALVFTQALHGLTFALVHMVAMHVIATCVPKHLAATAQTIYGALALGVASATLTFASGYLYGWFGMHAFWAMAAICAIALPFTGNIGDSKPAADRLS